MIRAFFIVLVIFVLLFFLSVSIGVGVYVGLMSFFSRSEKNDVEKN